MDAPRTILSLSLIDGYTGRISNKKKEALESIKELRINETYHQHIERDATKHKNEVLVHTDLGLRQDECHMIQMRNCIATNILLILGFSQ